MNPRRTVRLVPAALLVLAAALFLAPRVCYDVWYHVAVGELLLAQGALPRSEPFCQDPTAVAAHGFIVHEWLAEVALAEAWRAGGYGAVMLLKTLLLTGALGGLAWLLARRTGQPLLAAGLAALAVPALALRSYARPELFAFVLLVPHVAAFTRPGGYRRADLVVLPALTALWANLHGSFPLALLFPLAAWLEAPRSRRPPALLALSVAATLLNPSGATLWRFPLLYAHRAPIFDRVSEWRPFEFANAPSVEAGLLLAVGLLFALRYRWRPSHALVGLAGLHLALTAARHVALFPFLVLPLLAPRLAALLRLRGRGRPGVPAPAAAALAAALFGAGLWFGSEAALRLEREDPEAGLPRQAAEWLLRAQPPGRLFHPLRWGGYLIWKLHPLYRVFIDGRLDLYTEARQADYQAVDAVADGFDDLLARHRIDVVLAQNRTLLARKLVAHPGWRLAHADPLACVFLRETARPTAAP